MAINPLLQLNSFGQSIWLDFLSREILASGKLQRLIEEDGLRGVTSNPAIFQEAIASAKIAYQMYKDIFKSAEFGRLEQQGAKKQRVLWASTSTKNPEYSDVKYVEALIGPETINTMPLKTLDAYRDHGNPLPRLEEDIDKAYQVLDNLAKIGISIGEVTQQLEEEAVQKFVKPYDELMSLLAQEYERYRVAEVVGRPG